MQFHFIIRWADSWRREFLRPRGLKHPRETGHYDILEDIDKALEMKFPQGWTSMIRVDWPVMMLMVWIVLLILIL